VDWHQGDGYLNDGELGGAKSIITFPNPF